MGGPPPLGVWGETSTASLAVGAHSAHLTAGSSHQPFACTTCHEVPEANDIEHAFGYQIGDELSDPGHHGDVTLAATLPGMDWNLEASSGTPIAMRGSCVGGCHSDGQGGPPRTTPYWAGGNWTSGCANCHSDRPSSGTHRHALEEGGTCANCHGGSTTNMYSTASHMNGMVDYLGTVVGEGMTLTADPNCASGVSCNGPCHGEDEDHNNECW
jgi:predicted CxxxxCH...CXXCH cytochrome family protein